MAGRRAAAREAGGMMVYIDPWLDIAFDVIQLFGLAAVIFWCWRLQKMMKLLATALVEMPAKIVEREHNGHDA